MHLSGCEMARMTTIETKQQAIVSNRTTNPISNSDPSFRSAFSALNFLFDAMLSPDPGPKWIAVWSC
jgi:hypothetical protein